MRTDILDLAWRFFSARRLTIALLLVVALVLTCGAVLPQMPDELSVGSAEHARWYASIQARYLQWADPLAGLGLFARGDSLWLRVPLALLLVNLAVCTAQRSGSLLRERRLGPQELGRFLPPELETRSFLFAGDVPSALDRCRGLLEARGYGVRAQEADGDVHVAAERFHAARWGIPMAHAGLTLIVLGAIVSSRLSWQEAGIPLGPGQEYQVQHVGSTVVRLEDFTAEFYPDGKPQAYRANVALLENGSVATRGVLASGTPLWHRGISFYQLSHGPLVRIKAVDGEGRPITLQTLAPSSMAVEEASLQLSEDQREGYVAVPARNLVLRAAFRPAPASGAERSPGLLLQAYRGGTTEVVFSKTLRSSATVDIDGDSYTIGWRQYAIIGIAFDPTFPLVVLGATVLMLGVIATVCLRPRTIWASMTGRQGVVEMRLLWRGYASDVPQVREFDSLLAEIEEVCRGRR
jgi:cytochrome c biogenesis protein ResB